MMLTFTVIEPLLRLKIERKFISISYQEFYNKVKKIGGNNDAVTNNK
jgi:hypothetical protein